MSIQLHQQFFSSREQVLDDIKQAGLWPTTFVSGDSEGAPIHWHDYDVTVYIMEGETDFLDAARDIRVAVRAGDKFVVPAKALHAEGPVKGRVVYLIALPEALPPEQFLQMHEPE